MLRELGLGNHDFILQCRMVIDLVFLFFIKCISYAFPALKIIKYLQCDAKGNKKPSRLFAQFQEQPSIERQLSKG